jgi:hypothetical protein
LIEKRKKRGKGKIRAGREKEIWGKGEKENG